MRASTTFLPATALLLAGCGGGDPAADGDDAGAPLGDAGVECATATLVGPVPDGEDTLGPAADVDGEPCGATFAVDVTVATDAEEGTAADLMVNRTSRATATVSGARLVFDQVHLDNHGDTVNELAVSFGGCTAPVRDLYVDCSGVSCAIAAPESSDATLGPADDVDAAPGVQVDVEVLTDADAAGLPVVLSVDGVEVRDVEATGAGGGAVARFEAVDLDTGERTVQATCRDSRGNFTQSGAAEWTVTD